MVVIVEDDSSWEYSQETGPFCLGATTRFENISHVSKILDTWAFRIGLTPLVLDFVSPHHLVPLPGHIRETTLTQLRYIYG